MYTEKYNQMKFLLPVFGIILLLRINSVKAQDIHFSQFYEAPLQLNPALCGAFNGGMLAEVNYRNQWFKLAGANGFNTMAASLALHNLSGKWENSYLSTGLSFFSDRVGEANIGNAGVNLTLSSGVYIDENSCVSGGIQGGWSQYSVNTNSLQWGSQYINGNFDPMASTGETNMKSSSSYADVSAGLAYNYAMRPLNSASTENPFKVNAGIALFHLNQPDISYYNNTSASGNKLYMRFVMHGSVQYRIVETPISLVPAFVYYSQGPVNQFDLGLKVRYAISEKSRITGFSKNVIADFGSFLRFNDALVLAGGIQYDAVYFGLSYDVNVSQLASASYGKGGFEISFKYLNLDWYEGQDKHQHHAF